MSVSKKSFNFILHLIQGVTIGVGAVLPGISGGVLATVFGIYAPLMEVLAHPIKKFKKHVSLIIPVVIGIIVGFLGLAKVVTILFKSNEALAVCIFTGLIAGEIPSLIKNAKSYGGKKSSYISGFVAFAVVLSILLFFTYAKKISVTPNLFWYTLCGCFWSFGIIVPGMSASSPLLFLGLYEPLLDLITGAVGHLMSFVTAKESFSVAVTGMNIPSCLMFAFGFIAILVIFSRPVDALLKRFPSQMNFIITGVVAATVIPLIPTSFTSVGDFFIKIGCIVGGFAVAFFLELGTEYLEKKFGVNENETEEKI